MSDFFVYKIALRCGSCNWGPCASLLLLPSQLVNRKRKHRSHVSDGMCVFKSLFAFCFTKEKGDFSSRQCPQKCYHSWRVCGERHSCDGRECARTLSLAEGEDETKWRWDVVSAFTSFIIGRCTALGWSGPDIASRYRCQRPQHPPRWPACWQRTSLGPSSASGPERCVDRCCN